MIIRAVRTQAEYDEFKDLPGVLIEIRGATEDIFVSGSSTVTASGSSTVTAYGSSTVTASGSSTVTASGSSTVTAYGSSTVTASGSSTVTAYGATVLVVNPESAVSYTMPSKAAQIITRNAPPLITNEEWLDRWGIKANRGKVILYKRVSENWQTQENTRNETVWTPGTTIQHPAWDPTSGECGEGRYHAVYIPWEADKFRSVDGDRYIAIQIAVKDLYAWPTEPEYPEKIAFRAGRVLYECDAKGDKI